MPLMTLSLSGAGRSAESAESVELLPEIVPLRFGQAMECPEHSFVKNPEGVPERGLMVQAVQGHESAVCGRDRVPAVLAWDEKP